MDQRPSWETNRLAASKKNFRIWWKPKVPYLIYKYPPPVPILSQLDPVYNPKSQLLKIYLNIILPSTSRSSKRSLSPRFPNSSPHTCCTSCTSLQLYTKHTSGGDSMYIAHACLQPLVHCCLFSLNLRYFVHSRHLYMLQHITCLVPVLWMSVCFHSRIERS
jgi:hypothetical protein